jgi:RNA-directed DNA polymerase
MASVTRFIETRLKLQVNAAKSAVGRPWERSFLSYTVRNEPPARHRVAPKAIVLFKNRVRELTGRTRGVSLPRMIRDLNPVLRGWAGYFGLSQSGELASLDKWVRRRLRCVAWVQWKTRRRRIGELGRLGVTRVVAFAVTNSPKGPWRLSASAPMQTAFSKACLRTLGLVSMADFAKA